MLSFARSPRPSHIVGGLVSLFRTGDGVYGQELVLITSLEEKTI